MLLLATRLQVTAPRLGSLSLETVTHSEAKTDWGSHNVRELSVTASSFAMISLRQRKVR